MGKTRTEELREKMAKALRENHFREVMKYVELKSWEDCEVKDSWRAKADVALLVCKKADLGFMVKDAELPEWALSGIGSETEKAIYRVSQKDMLEAGYRKTKGIELT